MTTHSAITPIYLPSNYWRRHSQELADNFSPAEMKNFRSSQKKCVKAFAGANYSALDLNYRARFWRLHELLKKIPFLGKLSSIYEAEIQRENERTVSQWKYKMRCLYLLIEKADPTLLRDVADSLVGDPQTLEISGKIFSESFLLSLFELHELEQILGRDFFANASICEIGGGFGSMAEVVLKRYPKAKYTIVDLPPVLRFSHYYLSQVFPGEVSVQKNASDPIPTRIACVPNHFFENLTTKFDFFINVASFQEMTTDIVKNYAQIITKTIPHVYLNNCYDENKERPGLNAEFYKKVMQPMQVTHDWQNPLLGGYRKLIFSRN